MNRRSLALLIVILFFSVLFANNGIIDQDQIDNYKLYPEVNSNKPKLPSPFITVDGEEYVIAITDYGKYAIIPVSLGNNREFGPQLLVDTLDFPLLARDGLHDNKLLNSLTHITGWDLDTINDLGRPGGLSFDGFMAKGEDIRSILIHDNSIVSAMGLTHPEMAKPLFHLLNMMEADLALNRWNMVEHNWKHIRCFYYYDHLVHVDAKDTKGGQLSIFNDGIEGAFHIKLSRKARPQELALLARNYNHLSEDEYEKFKESLFTINMGEMEAQYIMRYGFYEGHTFWRTDPIAIALIFGMKTLSEIEEIFRGELDKVLTGYAVAPH